MTRDHKNDLFCQQTIIYSMTIGARNPGVLMGSKSEALQEYQSFISYQCLQIT